MSRWLILADTPLQVMHAIALVIDNLADKDDADLLILEQWDTATVTRKKLEELRIFRKVVSIPYPRLPSHRITTWAIGLAVNPNKAFRLKPYAELGPHDYFACSAPHIKTLDVLMYERSINGDIQTVFFDDGVGSYSGNVLTSAHMYLDALPKDLRESTAVTQSETLGKQMFRVFARPRHLYFDCTLLLIARPDLLQYDASFEVRKLAISETSIRLAGQVLQQRNSIAIPPCSIIVFDTKRFDDNRTDHACLLLDSLMNALAKKGIPFLYRGHPASASSTRPPVSRGGDISDGLWEAICADQKNLDTCLLVGFGSTTQLSPKLTVGVEPCLMFLDSMGQKGDGLTDVGGLSTAERIALQAYSDQTKISSPRTFSDAIDHIGKFVDSATPRLQ